MGRAETAGRKPRAIKPQGDFHEVMVGHVVRLFIEHHPVFAVNPLGDWQELVGDHMARYCQPQSLKKKVLTVIAHDSVWKHHLELLKDPLVEKINGDRPEPLVEKMVVRVGGLPATAPQLNPSLQSAEPSGSPKAHRMRRKKTPTRALTSEEKALLKTLPDPELRALGTRLLKRIPVDDG